MSADKFIDENSENSVVEQTDSKNSLCEYKSIIDKYKIKNKNLSFDVIFKQAPIGITISHNKEDGMDYSDNYYIVNPMFEKITGRTKQEITELGWEKFTHPDDLVEEKKYLHKLKSGEINSYTMDKRYIKKDGSCFWVNVVVAKLNLSSNLEFNHICFIQDISNRKEMEKSLGESERAKSVLLSHLPGMAYRCKFDDNWTMQYVSAGCYNLTGYTPENLIHNKDLSYNDIITSEYRDVIRKKWQRTLTEKLPFEYEYEIKTASGQRKWVLEMGQGIYNEAGEVLALEGIILDISDRKEIEDNLRYNNEHDISTGLYNRRYLVKLLNKDAKNKILNKRAVIRINLSTIHSLSLIYGFHYSQELNKKVAEHLKTYCNENRQLFGTYEYCFVFYIQNYKDKNELEAFCEEIGNALESMLTIERIGGGIGIIEINEDNKHNAELLLKNILIASEKAMNTDESSFGFCFFNNDMQMQIIREEQIKNELAKIVEEENNDNLFLDFQPIVDIKTNKISDFEALVRIRSDKLGLLTPMEFIPIAEKTKLITQLGRKIIILAFNFLNKLKENGHDSISVAINISVIQLLRKDFITNIVNLIDEMKVNPLNITFEITESIFASDYQEINKILSDLQKIGIKIAIDDFGTGYSSLARERELNANILKIDKYFSDKLLLFNEDSITGDIILMARKLGHIVIAEGVEHESQRQYLIDNGCDKLQGYLISKPLCEDEAIKLLKNN